MTFKNCTKCGENKPADTDHFYFRNGRSIAACKECTKAHNNKKYAEDPEHRQKIIDHQRKPEVRERANQREKERRANDLEWRDAENARLRARYHNDPVHRETLLSRQRSPEVRAKTNRRNRERRANDPEWRATNNAKQRNRYHDNPEFRARADDYKLTRAYGITTAEREQMEQEQCGRCSICEQLGKLFIDHDHGTGQVRGLLCPGCNAGLGQFDERAEFMLSAVEYLCASWRKPEEIPTIQDIQLFARLEIPNWGAQSRDKKFRSRKNTQLKSVYAISIDQYEWLLAKGNGICWVCLRPEERKRRHKQRYPDALHVDHDHQTGMIRGLLCGKCNNGVGAFSDDPERIRRAMDYLQRW